MKKSVIVLALTVLFAGSLMLGGCGGGGSDNTVLLPPPTPTTPTTPTDPVTPPPTPTDPTPPAPPVPPPAPTTAAVPVSAAGTVTDGGSAVDTTYTIAAGDYTYSIAGFGKGDKLVFPSTQTPTINNSNFTDGFVDVQWSFGGQTVVVRLTGLTNEQDVAIYSVRSFNEYFGAESLK